MVRAGQDVCLLTLAKSGPLPTVHGAWQYDFTPRTSNL
jgi:hypothetical protein